VGRTSDFVKGKGMTQAKKVYEVRSRAYEVKYVIPPDRAEEIRLWSRQHLDPDPNADGGQGDGYRTTSIYFDTDRFDIFHRKGSFGRVKYRIRRYNAGESAFLERKLRIRDTVTKRRSLVGLGDLGWLCAEKAHSGWDGFWFHRRILARQLKPVCQISYLRTARVSAAPGGVIRLTLDQDIQALPLDRMAFRPPNGGVRLAQGVYILELKFHHQMPVLFKGLIERFALDPKPYSKYRTAAVALGYVAAPAATGPVKGNLETSYA